MNQLVPLSSLPVPALVTAAGDRARVRFLEFFAANIRNAHTRHACASSAARGDQARQRREGNARRDCALLQCQPLDDFAVDKLTASLTASNRDN
jgi:DUF971 family protein